MTALTIAGGTLIVGQFVAIIALHRLVNRTRLERDKLQRRLRCVVRQRDQG